MLDCVHSSRCARAPRHWPTVAKRPNHVPPSWFCATSTGFSAFKFRACCIPVPDGVRFRFRPEFPPCLPRNAFSLRRTTRPQPYDVTAADPSAPFIRDVSITNSTPRFYSAAGLFRLRGRCQPRDVLPSMGLVPPEISNAHRNGRRLQSPKCLRASSKGSRRQRACRSRCPSGGEPSIGQARRTRSFRSAPEPSGDGWVSAGPVPTPLHGRRPHFRPCLGNLIPICLGANSRALGCVILSGTASAGMRSRFPLGSLFPIVRMTTVGPLARPLG